MNAALPPLPDRQLLGLYRLLAPLLAVGVLFVGLTLTLFTGHPIGGWLLVAFFLAASLLIGFPRRLLGFFLFLVVVHPTLQNLHSHWLLQLADKLTALLLLVVVILTFIKDRRDRSHLRAFNRILFLFIGLAGVGAVVNRVPPIQVLRFFLTYGTFIPVFYLAVHFMQPNPTEARRAIRIILLIFLAQIALNIGWIVGINPLPNHYAGGVDFAIGTLGISNAVAYLTAATLFLLFALFHASEDLKYKALSAVGGLLAMVQLVVTFTFHLFPPMFALLCFQSLYGVKRLRYKIAMLALVATVVTGFFYIKSDPRLSRTFGFPADDMMSMAVFQGRWRQMWSGNKGQAYYNIFVRARRDMPAWFIGAGPGNFASGIGIVHRSVLAEKYVNYIYLTYSGRMEMVGGSVTQHVTTGVSAIYSEFGPLGLLLFFGLHGLAAVRVLRQLRRDAYQSVVRRALAEAFIPTMLLYIGLNLISDFLSSTFLQVGVWCWAGLVWKPDSEPDDGDGVSVFS